MGGNLSKVNWDDMALENTYSISSAANHAICFTNLTMQHFASQPENRNVSFTNALPGAVRTPILNNLPFWARIPMKGLFALGVAVLPEDCAELMVHGMLGTDKGWRRVNDKGETVTNLKPVPDEMIEKVWEHTSRMISPSR